MTFADTHSWRHLAGPICALAALSCLCGASGAAAQSSGWVTRQESSWRRPPDRTSSLPREIELRATGEGLDRIELGHENLQDGRMRTEPITDVLVRLKPAVQQLRGVQGRDAATPAEPDRSYIEAQVLAVAGGRISPAAVAQCRQFEGDMLICSVDCEGGAFGLRRGRDQAEHHLVIGVSDPLADRDLGSSRAKPGFKLSACSARSTAPIFLMPRAGRLAAELRLLESR